MIKRFAVIFAMLAIVVSMAACPKQAPVSATSEQPDGSRHTYRGTSAGFLALLKTRSYNQPNPAYQHALTTLSDDAARDGGVFVYDHGNFTYVPDQQTASSFYGYWENHTDWDIQVEIKITANSVLAFRIPPQQPHLFQVLPGTYSFSVKRVKDNKLLESGEIHPDAYNNDSWSAMAQKRVAFVYATYPR